MSAGRLPVAGEVWRQRGSDESVTIDMVKNDLIVLSGIGGDGREYTWTWRDAALFSTVYAPPAEPWEKPHAMKRWAAVAEDGTLMTNAQPTSLSKTLMYSSALANEVCRAIVQCDVVPDMSTFEKVER